MREITSLEQGKDLFSQGEDLYEGYAFQEIDFAQINLRDLYKVEFSHCSFYKCNFAGVRLENCFFVDVSFEKSDFSNANAALCSLRRVVFQSCKMVGADWSDGVFSFVKWMDTVGRYVNFTHSKFEDSLFCRCDFTEAILEQCVLKRLVLTECNLQQVSFFGTPLKNIDLSDCKIGGIRLSFADLRGAVVEASQVFDLAALLEVRIK